MEKKIYKNYYMEHYVLRQMTSKKVRDRKIDRSLLVDLSIDRASKQWYSHHEQLFKRLYNYLVIRTNSRHFVTIRPSTSYIISRYFNHKIPTHKAYVNWFREKIKKLSKDIVIVMSIESNGKDKIGCHAHIVCCGMSNSHFEKQRMKYRDAFTIDHKIYGKQAAVYVSKKCMNTIKQGYCYFLGKIREPDKRNVESKNYNFKPSYICNDHTLTKQQIDNICKDKKIEQCMVEYNEFINNLKTLKKNV